MKNIQISDTNRNVHRLMIGRSPFGMRVCAILGVVAFSALIGCSQRPPNCTDADILAAALDNIIDIYDEDSPGLRDYKQKVKLTEVEVIQNKQTKANQLCVSTATVNSPSGQKFSVKIAFQTVLENGKATRDTQAREGFISDISRDMWNYVLAQNKTANLPSSPKTPEELRLQAMSYEQLAQEAKAAEASYGAIEQGLPANTRKDMHLDEMKFKANQYSACEAAAEKASRKGLPKREYLLICKIQSFNERAIQLRGLEPKVQPNETSTLVSQTAAIETTPSVADTANANAGTQVKETAQNKVVQKSPSFDCAKASTKTEKSICEDSSLSSMDSDFAENYRNVLKSNISDNARVTIKASQKEWLTARDKCQTNQY
jgi:uncharacterized protein YecT (DUF1311 family)